MFFFAGILLTDGLKYIEEIRTSLLGVTSLFVFAGFIEGAFGAGEDMKLHLVNVLKIALIGALAFNFSSIIQEGDKVLAELHSSISQQQQDAFRQQIEADGEEPNWSDIPGRISYTLGICLQKIGRIGYSFVYWIKDISILLLIAISPFLIGCLAFSYTKSIGVNFLITSLTVILWNIGFAIVDTLLIILGNVIMPIMGAGTAGVASSAVVTVGPQFLGLCLIAAILPISMYFSVPIITGAIMRGSNVAGAAMSAFGMAKQTASHAGTLVSGVTSGVSNGMASLSGSSSFEGSSPSLPTASSPFMKGTSEAGSSGASVGSPIPSSGGSGGFASSLGGSSASSPSDITSSDGNMVAHQSDSGTISVTDSAGRISSRPGKISDPVTVAAAFSSHEATNT